MRETIEPSGERNRLTCVGLFALFCNWLWLLFLLFSWLSSFPSFVIILPLSFFVSSLHLITFLCISCFLFFFRHVFISLFSPSSQIFLFFFSFVIFFIISVSRCLSPFQLSFVFIWYHFLSIYPFISFYHPLFQSVSLSFHFTFLFPPSSVFFFLSISFYINFLPYLCFSDRLFFISFFLLPCTHSSTHSTTFFLSFSPFNF